MTKLEVMEDLVKRFPKISPIMILKVSLAVKGAVISPAAIKRIQEKDLRFTKGTPYGLRFDIFKEDFYLPGSVLFRDGSTVFINYGEPYEDPFTIDWDEADEVFLVKEGETVIDIIDYVPRPEFFDYQTSKGVPMDIIGGNGTGTKIYFNAYQRCRFWEERNQCHYCALFTSPKVIREPDTEDAYETLMRAIAEPGRFTEVEISGGTDFGGEPAFSNEINRYIRFINAIARDLKKPLPVQLMAPAYEKEMLKRIREETGIGSYRSNIEVWDESMFKKLCPGKEKWVGYDNWIRRLYDGVEVFGEGKVHTNIVCGAELAKPNGMTSVDKAIESAKNCVDTMTAHGVHASISIWRPHKNEVLGWQPMQEPEYYVKICQAFYDRINAHGSPMAGNFKRGSDSPESDLQRGYMADDIPVKSQYAPYAVTGGFLEKGHVSTVVADMLSNPGTKVFAEVTELGERRYLDTGMSPVVKDNALMLPLETDRDRLSAYLVKKIWYRQPLKLIFVCEGRAVSAHVRVWRNHTLGKVFKELYKEMNRDLASVVEFRSFGETEAFDPGTLEGRIMENTGIKGQSHLDKMIK